MLQNGESFESNLLFREPCIIDPETMVDNMQETVADHGFFIYSAEVDDSGFMMLTCDGMQILVAFSEDPLPVEHFRSVNRPITARTGEDAMICRLGQHATNATILVMDTALGDGSGLSVTDQARAEVCWDLTDCLSDMTGPDLVFWCASDTLYTAEEFEDACADKALESVYGEMPAPEVLSIDARRLPEHFLTDPMMSAATLDWLDRTMTLRPNAGQPHDTSDEMELPTAPGDQSPPYGRQAMPASGFPARLIGRIADPAVGSRVVNGLVMTMATYSIGSGGLPVLSMIGL